MCLGKAKGATFRIISLILVFSFMASFVVPRDALAARSRAGGGDVPEFSFNDFAATAGMSLGMFVAGQALGGILSSGIGDLWSGLKSAAGFADQGSSLLSEGSTLSRMAESFISPFSSADNFAMTMVKGYNTFMATSQVSRAIGTMGAYSDWNPRKTYVLSAISTGLTAGLLNPDIALARQGMDSALASSILSPPIDTGSLFNMAKGAFVGGLQQGASSLVVVAIDGAQLSRGKSPGALAQLSGLIAGTAAGNLARELVNPSAQLLRSYEIENQGSYAEITEVKDGFKMTEPSSSRGEVSDFIRHEQEQFGAENIKTILESNTLKIYNIDPGITASGLFKASVTNTLDMWPMFAGKGIGYLTGELLGNGLTDDERNKRPLATLARGLAESTFTSIFSGAASTWGLIPSLYIGTDADVMNAQLAYSSSIAAAAKLKRVEDYKAELDDEIGPLKEQLRNNQIDQEKYDIQVMSQANDLARKYGFIDSDEKLPLLASKGGSGENFVRNQAIRESGNALEQLMKDDSVPHLSDKLDAAQVSKFDLFASKVKDGLLSRVFETGIKTGVQAVFQSKARLNQQSPSYDYMEALMVSGLTNIGMALVRGVVWNLGWEPASSNSYWFQGPESVKVRPTPPTAEQYNDLLAAKTAEFKYAKYDAESALYKDFLDRSGVDEVTAPRENQESVLQVEVGFREEAPSLASAIGMSLRQATLESFVGAYSFGMPLGRPDRISSLQLLQYTNLLKSRASQANNVNRGGFTGALADFVVDANLSAASNSLLGTAAQIKPLRDFIGIAPERLMKTNAPGIPYTLQYSQEIPGLTNYNVSSYLTYPNPLATVKSRNKR